MSIENNFPEPISRGPETCAQYEGHMTTLTQSFKNETNETYSFPLLIEWFVEQNLQYSKSTIRSYRAALAMQIEIEVNNGNAVQQERDGWLKILESAPLPKPPGTNKKTSSLKLKKVDNDELDSLFESLEGREKKQGKRQIPSAVYPLELDVFSASR